MPRKLKQSNPNLKDLRFFAFFFFSLEREVERGEQVEYLEGQPADAEDEDDHEEHLGHPPLVGLKIILNKNTTAFWKTVEREKKLFPGAHQYCFVPLLVGVAWRVHPPERLKGRDQPFNKKL